MIAEQVRNGINLTKNEISQILHGSFEEAIGQSMQ
jgi:hypothetical protein